MSLWSEYNASDVLWLGDWGWGWIAGLALLGLGVLALSAYDLAPLGRKQRWSLLGLRAAIYALALTLLLEPAIDLKHVSRVKNQVAVLVDTSQSMALPSEDPAQTRRQRVSDALAKLEPLREAWREEHELSFYSFDSALTPSTLAALTQAPTRGDATDLTGALEQLRARTRGQELGGVIVLSDGIDTGAMGRRTRPDEPLDAGSAALVQSLGAPINTLAAARAEGMRDLAITHIARDDFAFVHNKVSVTVTLHATGLGEQAVPVSLRREGELLQTREVRVRGDQRVYTVSFEFVPRRIGREVYTVSAPVLPDEALDTNNTRHFLLRVIRDKVRVLQVVGQPSWDERFLRQLLKRNPNFDLISFFILRTNASVSDVPTEEMSLIPFPTDELFNEELGSFDLVIFQNFEFGPYRMSQYLSGIRDFVKRGGAFAMVGGAQSFASGGYAGTALEELLPVQLPGRGGELIDLEPFRPELTEAGSRHPITQLAFDPQQNRSIWEGLPQQRGTNRVLQAREGATVLATHPRLRAGGKPMPVLTVGQQEQGRTMALTTDDSWRWGFEALADGATSREYQTFWTNAIRWLIQDPELKLLRLELVQDTWAPEDTVKAQVLVAQPDYAPASDVEGQVVVRRRALESLGDDDASAVEVATLPFKTGLNGQAALSFAPRESGVYTLVASATTASGALRDETTVLVIPQINEHGQIIARDDLLRAIAQASGASAQALPDFSPSRLRLEPPRTMKVNKRRVIQLWDATLTFALILLLLGVEWSLRRRWGRL